MDKKKLFLESISRLNISKEKVTAVRSLLEECMEYSNHDETGANWKVQIWPGSGYTLGEFNVAASSDEEALEKVAAILTRDNQKAYYITQKEYDDMFSQELDVDPDYESDQYVYVDGTMEGASEPIYINAENLQVNPIGETESGKMESVDSASEVSDGINDGTESDESQKPIDDPNSTVADESMTIDQMWDALIDKGVTEQTLDLITSINGYSKDTLHDVLFAYTGYRDFEQANSDN